MRGLWGPRFGGFGGCALGDARINQINPLQLLTDVIRPAYIPPPRRRRYHTNTNILLAGITKQLKWADGGKVGRLGKRLESSFTA